MNPLLRGYQEAAKTSLIERYEDWLDGLIERMLTCWKTALGAVLASMAIGALLGLVVGYVLQNLWRL